MKSQSSQSSQLSQMRSELSQMRSLRVNITEKFYHLHHSIVKLCSRKMYQCRYCEKTFSRKNNMKRHQIQTCKGKIQNGNITSSTSMIQPKEKIVGDILNKVVQRSEMDVQPMTEKLPSHLSKKTIHRSIPTEAIKNVEPKPLTDIAMDLEEKVTPDPSAMDISDSESDESDSEESESEDVEFMPDNPRELIESFRKMYNKFHRDIEMYNKLVLMLDEMERMKYLTKEECNAMNEHLQKKIGI